MKIALGLAVFVVIGAVLFGVYGKKLTNQPGAVNQVQNQNQVTSQASETVNPSGEYTINELLTMNKPLKCAWKESATGDKDVTNIIYISGKKFYQDVTMSDIGHSFTISDGDYLYIWNDFNDMASKMKYSQIKTSPVPGQGKTPGASGQEQKRDFICEKWSVDNSVFSPPNDKNFKDVTEEMTQAVQEIGNGGLENSKQQLCDMCRNAPSQELIDKCLENAQCN